MQNLQVFVRANNPNVRLANLEILEGDTLLSTKLIHGNELLRNNLWTKIDLNFEKRNEDKLLIIRFFWFGEFNLDISCISIL